MRKALIAANWKMYKTPAEALAFVEAFLPLVASHTRDEIVLFPAHVSLPTVIPAVKNSNVLVGAQNMHWQAEGAYTGEVSAGMLTSLGCTHVLIGHSERRQYFCETDEIVNQKLKTALANDLVPVVCVGEHLDEREANRTEEVLRRQVGRGLINIAPEEAGTVAIAYEPVWAIGTGRTATPELAAEAHLIIRSQVAQMLGREFAEKLRILYGGSVKPENAPALLNQPEIDGALVGGASLDPASFAKIVQYTTF
jgi:triosephosphate isomerase